MIKGSFTPDERRYASGTAYLRGMGRGQVRTVHGVDELQREIGHLVVDARLPQPGQPADARTRVRASSPCGTRTPPWCEDALDRIVATARVELVESR